MNKDLRLNWVFCNRNGHVTIVCWLSFVLRTWLYIMRPSPQRRWYLVGDAIILSHTSPTRFILVCMQSTHTMQDNLKTTFDHRWIECGVFDYMRPWLVSHRIQSWFSYKDCEITVLAMLLHYIQQHCSKLANCFLVYFKQQGKTIF